MIKLTLLGKERVFRHDTQVILFARGDENKVEYADMHHGLARVAIIRVNDPAVSKIHCRISFIEGEYIISDAGSTNKTVVNGACVIRKVIHSGDEIVIGNTRVGCEIKREPSLRVLNGDKHGKVFVLNRSSFTVGTPGKTVAALTRAQTGFFLVPISGAYPTVNGRDIRENGSQLLPYDLIEINGTEVEYLE